MFFQPTSTNFDIVFSGISCSKSTNFPKYSPNIHFSLFPSELELVFLNNIIMEQQYWLKNLTMKLWLKSGYFTISEAADSILQEIYIIEENTEQKTVKMSENEQENSKTQEKTEKKIKSCPSFTIVPLIENKPVKRAQSFQRFVNKKKNSSNDISSIVKEINSRSDEKIKRILLNFIETEPLKKENIFIVDTLITRIFSCTDRLQLININELNRFLCVNSRENFQRLFLERLEEFFIEFSSENEIFEEKKCRFLKVFFKDFEGIVKKEHIMNILLRMMLKIIDLLFLLENCDKIKRNIGTIILIQGFLNKTLINEDIYHKEREEIFAKIMKFMKKVQRIREKYGGSDNDIIMKISQKFVEILIGT